MRFRNRWIYAIALFAWFGCASPLQASAFKKCPGKSGQVYRINPWQRINTHYKILKVSSLAQDRVNLNLTRLSFAKKYLSASTMERLAMLDYSCLFLDSKALCRTLTKKHEENTPILSFPEFDGSSHLSRSSVFPLPRFLDANGVPRKFSRSDSTRSAKPVFVSCKNKYALFVDASTLYVYINDSHEELRDYVLIEVDAHDIQVKNLERFSGF